MREKCDIMGVRNWNLWRYHYEKYYVWYSLMLLAIFLFMWCGFMKSMYVLMWIAIALILIGFIIAVVGYISKDKK